MSFYDRKKLSEKYLPIIKKISNKKCFSIKRIGIDTYKKDDINDAIYDILMSNETRYDPVIHSLRFSGNLIFFYNNKGYKAEMNYSTSEHDFYSIEIDSYEGMLNESKRFPKYSVFFILITDNRIDACWIEHINFHEIRIPKWRALKYEIDTEKYFKEKKRKYPKCEKIHFTNERDKGSGTPYGFIYKNASYIKPLSKFLENIKKRQQV